MFLAYYMEDTKVKRKFVIELSTGWLRAKSSKKGENAISSTDFAKTKIKPGNKV
jgi:hypothetical protein